MWRDLILFKKHTINQSINQSSKPSINQSINQSLTHSLTQSINESINYPQKKKTSIRCSSPIIHPHPAYPIVAFSLAFRANRRSSSVTKFPVALCPPPRRTSQDTLENRLDGHYFGMAASGLIMGGGELWFVMFFCVFSLFPHKKSSNHHGDGWVGEVWKVCKCMMKNEEVISYMGATPKMVAFPNKPMGFPTKNDHFGVFWGYHHLRKHPYSLLYSLHTKSFQFHDIGNRTRSPLGLAWRRNGIIIWYLVAVPNLLLSSSICLKITPWNPKRHKKHQKKLYRY